MIIGENGSIFIPVSRLKRTLWKAFYYAAAAAPQIPCPEEDHNGGRVTRTIVILYLGK